MGGGGGGSASRMPFSLWVGAVPSWGLQNPFDLAEHTAKLSLSLSLCKIRFNIKCKRGWQRAGGNLGWMAP